MLIKSLKDNKPSKFLRKINSTNFNILSKFILFQNLNNSPPDVPCGVMHAVSLFKSCFNSN